MCREIVDALTPPAGDVEGLREALEAIADLDIPRPVGKAASDMEIRRAHWESEERLHDAITEQAAEIERLTGDRDAWKAGAAGEFIARQDAEAERDALAKRVEAKDKVLKIVRQCIEDGGAGWGGYVIIDTIDQALASQPDTEGK